MKVNLDSGMFINSLCKWKEDHSTSILGVTNINKFLFSLFQDLMLFVIFLGIPVCRSMHPDLTHVSLLHKPEIQKQQILPYRGFAFIIIKHFKTLI